MNCLGMKSYQMMMNLSETDTSDMETDTEESLSTDSDYYFCDSIISEAA